MYWIGFHKSVTLFTHLYLLLLEQVYNGRILIIYFSL